MVGRTEADRQITSEPWSSRQKSNKNNEDPRRPERQILANRGALPTAIRMFLPQYSQSQVVPIRKSSSQFVALNIIESRLLHVETSILRHDLDANPCDQYNRHLLSLPGIVW